MDRQYIGYVVLTVAYDYAQYLLSCETLNPVAEVNDTDTNFAIAAMDNLDDTGNTVSDVSVTCSIP